MLREIYLIARIRTVSLEMVVFSVKSNTCVYSFNPFVPNGIVYHNFLDRPISKRRHVWSFLVLLCFIEIPVFNANSIDPDQTPPSAASDRGLHCLPMSLLWDARLMVKWVKLMSRTCTDLPVHVTFMGDIVKDPTR